MATTSDLQTKKGGRLGAKGAGLDGDFEFRARTIFGQFSDPLQRAMEDSKMMWLAWRGDERYIQAHLSDQPGFESAWRFCDYRDVDDFVHRFKHVDVRPIHPPFADHVLAHLAVLLQRVVNEKDGAKIYTLSTAEGGQGVTGKETEIGGAYGLAKEGLEVMADWLKEPNGFLKSKSVSLSSSRFLYVDFIHEKKDRPTNAGGFMYVLSAKERASARRRKRSLIKWILYDY